MAIVKITVRKDQVEETRKALDSFTHSEGIVEKHDKDQFNILHYQVRPEDVEELKQKANEYAVNIFSY